MSLIKSYGRKHRSVKKTFLIIGEGLGEVVFLKHLKSLYSLDNNTDVRIRKGKGGSAESVVIDACLYRGDFFKRSVVIDNDRGEEMMKKAREEAEKRGINVIENLPCLEALLLSILENAKQFDKETTKWCKKEFHSKYLDEKTRRDPEKFAAKFPKSLLDKQQLKIPMLKTLILLVQGAK